MVGDTPRGDAAPAPAPAAAPRWVEDRLQRPGSLLDIRV